ncbi:MAG: hypothetical protein ACI9OJ_000299 [Myxococcota bacterium]
MVILSSDLAIAALAIPTFFVPPGWDLPVPPEEAWQAVAACASPASPEYAETVIFQNGPYPLSWYEEGRFAMVFIPRAYVEGEVSRQFLAHAVHHELAHAFNPVFCGVGEGKVIRYTTNGGTRLLHGCNVRPGVSATPWDFVFNEGRAEIVAQCAMAINGWSPFWIDGYNTDIFPGKQGAEKGVAWYNQARGFVRALTYLTSHEVVMSSQSLNDIRRGSAEVDACLKRFMALPPEEMTVLLSPGTGPPRLVHYCREATAEHSESSGKSQ